MKVNNELSGLVVEVVERFLECPINFSEAGRFALRTDPFRLVEVLAAAGIVKIQANSMYSRR
jgi:hypothetical protein